MEKRRNRFIAVVAVILQLRLAICVVQFPGSKATTDCNSITILSPLGVTSGQPSNKIHRLKDHVGMLSRQGVFS
jgi:hypothetical protein